MIEDSGKCSLKALSPGIEVWIAEECVGLQATDDQYSGKGDLFVKWDLQEPQDEAQMDTGFPSPSLKAFS